MKVQSRKVVVLELDNGRIPFEDWLASIKDVTLQRAVDARIARVRDGNFGDHKGVGRGVYELRIHKGPGLRVYYGLQDGALVLILCGGDKSSQRKDIKYAQTLWRQFCDENEGL
ncbi:type II toxin-antitoxin system RelE/ParE family toxin [bacterium]|nr:type II toxin-antitoxin system RelE/ParE family toxin [bacterium]